MGLWEFLKINKIIGEIQKWKKKLIYLAKNLKIFGFLRFFKITEIMQKFKNDKKN